jgi:hypothetical protein
MLVPQRPIYQTIKFDDYQSMAGPDWPPYDVFIVGDQIDDFVAQELDAMLNVTEDQKNKISNFCVLPFYGREYPTNRHCCLMKEDADIYQVRSDMILNQRTSACQVCWSLEDVGIQSDRQLKNKTLDFFSDTDITKLFEIAVQGKYYVTQYKISAGNFCNSTCVTCGPMHSSAWGELVNNHSKKIIPMMLKWGWPSGVVVRRHNVSFM